MLLEIAAAMVQECRTARVDFRPLYDRLEVIAFAVGLAQPGDIVLTCGKAHENSMCYGTEETPWDEFAAVQAALARRRG